jgi:hypothetical protein
MANNKRTHTRKRRTRFAQFKGKIVDAVEAQYHGLRLRQAMANNFNLKQDPPKGGFLIDSTIFTIYATK